MLEFWRYHRYPGHRWGKVIAEILQRLARDDATIIDATIIDAPCGDGIISYWLIKAGVGRKFELCDLSEHSITMARKMLSWRRTAPLNLRIDCRNIFDIPADHATNDVWLLINSLYLLPDIDKLLTHMRVRAQTIIAVFPRISSKNYQHWLARSPNVNISEMGPAETVAFFAKHGYQLKEQRELSYIPLMHLRSKYIRLAAMYLVNPFEALYPRKEACYWLGVFTRSANEKVG